MLRYFVRINGHNHAAQTIPRQPSHILLRPQRSIRANHRMNSTLGGVAGHRRQLAVRQRFAPDEQQIADVVLNANIDDIAGFRQGHTPPLFRIEAVHRESTKVTFCVADVRDSELQVPRPAMIEHVAKKFKNPILGLANRRRIIRRRGRKGTRRFNFCTCGIGHGDKVAYVAANATASQLFLLALPS